jgi:hypothetical protein
MTSPRRFDLDGKTQISLGVSLGNERGSRKRIEIYLVLLCYEEILTRRDLD